MHGWSWQQLPAGAAAGRTTGADDWARAQCEQASSQTPLPGSRPGAAALHTPASAPPLRLRRRAVLAGSYGSVAEALDHATDPPRRVAIKRIPNVFDVFENAKRIYREISILRVLAHPNITGILHLERPP